MNRETAVRCDRYVPRHRPARMCEFTLARETYGDSVAYRGRCVVHLGGEIAIGLAHRVGPDPRRKTTVDPDYRGELRSAEEMTSS